MTSTDTSSVEIGFREAGGFAIVEINAPNFTYPQSGILKNRVAHLIESGHRFFALDCNNVGLVDSYGLASIVSTLKIIREVNGGLVLFGASELFEKLVEVTQLQRVLELWASEAQALYCLEEMKKSQK